LTGKLHYTYVTESSQSQELEILERAELEKFGR